MNDQININNIKHNTNNFKFIDTIGSFINNIKFKSGHNDYLNNINNQYSYIWNSLSAIGDDYAEIIYENILNYIDNVSNVDLCKIKALQSMLNIIGVKYNVLDTFDKIPIEIANLMDILSINRSYLLQSNKFNNEFIEELSSYGCIKYADLSQSVALSGEVSNDAMLSVNNQYIDEDSYRSFIQQIYQQILYKYIYLQYADSENNLPSDYTYIYQYIQHELILQQNPSTIDNLSEHQQYISSLKLKYGISYKFDPITIVDNIENGYDTVDNYNEYEQLIIKNEILYREQTYSYIKRYTDQAEKFLGYNLTRYSYYREKKVRQYFQYIENTYNNLIFDANIKSTLLNNNPIRITQYDKNINYFDIESNDIKTLLKYEPTTQHIEIQTSLIYQVASLLAEQTLQIANIRDQIKTQIRKSYMRGTFLLISYVINEFLKFGIQQKYGTYLYTKEGQSLSSILETSLNNDNIQLIEYYDNTEYFNISASNNNLVLNANTVNEKFWDNFYNKIGKNTKDIPLNQIENFYLNQLKLKDNKVTDIINFLSIVYEHGANDSFINKNTNEFTCKLNNGKIIGDPINEISNLNNVASTIDNAISIINTNIDNGYQYIPNTSVQQQLYELSSFNFNYNKNEIISKNETLTEEIYSKYSSDLDQFDIIGNKLIELSNLYDKLLTNTKYNQYISSYVEIDSHFINKLNNLYISCINSTGITWDYTELKTKLQLLLDNYYELSTNLYSKLFALSVWNSNTIDGNRIDYWPYYSPNYDNELTSVTNDLKTFLLQQVEICNKTPTDTTSIARLSRINNINLSTGNPYNIVWINTTFNNIKLSVDELLNTYSQYFEIYSHNNINRLDKQILEISTYIINHDVQNRNDVISEINTLSADYNIQLNEFNSYRSTIFRDMVNSVNDDLTYNINQCLYDNEIYSTISTTYGKYLDYLLSNNINGVINWISVSAYTLFDNSISDAINTKILELPDYINTICAINNISTQYLDEYLYNNSNILDELNTIKSSTSSEISYISGQISSYNSQKEIYLKYNGNTIGYDPFYNYKNLAYSSYQLHPYLFNFIEKSNLIYPLINSFYSVFDEKYEQHLYEKNIDNIIGKYGNIKNLWNNGLFDWTGYQSKYAKTASQSNVNNPLIGFTGLFYQPALDEFLKYPNEFIQNVQDNSLNSYYHHLNLSLDASNKIAAQLTAYYDAIKYLTQYNTRNISIQNEYDIYKFAEDANGNQLFLLKSYAYLYDQHKSDPNYTPSYNEKKNTLGEVWMRIKNHPLAFPAFDIRPGSENISQYNVIQNININGKPINGYLFSINEYISNCNTIVQQYCRDLTNRYNEYDNKQYLRCFFDFELDPTLRALLLVVPYKTGTNHRKIMLNGNNYISNPLQFKYANSSILLGYLEHPQNNIAGIQTFNFIADDKNTDNIYNKNMLLPSSTSSSFSEFVGFSINNIYIFVIYVEKYGTRNNNNIIYHSFRQRTLNGYIPYVKLNYVAYKLHTQPKYMYVTSDELKYDIYNVYRDNNVIESEKHKYINASNVVITTSNNLLTIGFLTERISPSVNNTYLSTSTIVNFVEYSQIIDNIIPNYEAGLNRNYPTSTALIQTTDADRINIYNSFDSFVQHLVNVTFEFNLNTIKFKDIKYFNLHSDLGYIPQYPDIHGKNNLYANSSIKDQIEYHIELLGPEKSDIPFTPIIKDNADEKYGRVVEDYKDFNKVESYNSEIIIANNAQCVQYTFELSSVFPVNEWSTLNETTDLLRYKYIFYNTSYETLPISKGDLSCNLPNGYYYQFEEKYDLLSGEEIFGSNQTTYQNVSMTNHIDNISAIQLSVIFNEDTLLPNKIQLSCFVREPINDIQIIPTNTFRLFIYAKNNVKSYDYYHLFENANKSVDNITHDEVSQIFFNDISSISSYEIPNTNKKPFENKASNETNPRKLSAMLEFKYSEQETINREFPYLDASDVEDEIIVLQNDTQSIYYTALDDNTSIDRSNIKLNVYNTSTSAYYERTINTRLPKYNDFYDKTLRIETTYNMEKLINNEDKYEIVLYFNYKNFTHPSYINFKQQDNKPPIANAYNSIDKDIQTTYLVLRPGENGILDIRVDYIFYGKLNTTDISESILGHSFEILKRYYIMNISDDKPKFIISRVPFGSTK